MVPSSSPHRIALVGVIASIAVSSLPACVPASSVAAIQSNGVHSTPRMLLRLRGGSSAYRTGGLWGSPAEPKTTSEELKKNVQRLLEKHTSGVMGRDLRRLYKEVGDLNV